MSVQTEIDRISTAVQNAHLKVIAKGGKSAAPYLVANLPDAIDTIPEGGGGGATYYYMDEENVVETEFGYMYRVSDMTLEEFASRNFEAHFCQGYTDASFIETVSFSLNKDENARTNIVDTGNGLKALELIDDAVTLKVAYSFTKEYAESNSLQQGVYLSVIADDVYGVYTFIIPLFIVLH